jgi:hypothetical protein
VPDLGAPPLPPPTPAAVFINGGGGNGTGAKAQLNWTISPWSTPVVLINSRTNSSLIPGYLGAGTQ